MLLVVVCCLLVLLVLLFCKSVSSIILGFRGEKESGGLDLDLSWNVGVGGVIKNFVGGFKKTDVSLSASFLFVILTSQPHLHLFPPSLFFQNSKRKRERWGRERNTKKNSFII